MLGGIRGCWLFYHECADCSDEDLAGDFEDDQSVDDQVGARNFANHANTVERRIPSDFATSSG